MPETTVFDHYEVMRREDGSLIELGRGAMGITYKAFDTSLRVPVALKVINAASIHSEVARQRFVREARAAALLRHRNVASVFHLGMAGDTYFYAMEFIEGETAESLVRRGGPLAPALALRIAVQVARALNAAQKQGLVHRDIKPSNLMLVHEDEELIVKVIDFGLAKSRRGEENLAEITLAAAGFLGTPHFASPEQLEELDLDVRSDIYSLGVTLWYLLVGEAPFSGSLAQVMSHHLHSAPPVERIAALPEPVRVLLIEMLAKKPADRPQTPVELRARLEQCLESLGPVGSSITLLPQSGTRPETAFRRETFRPGAIVDGRYELIRDLGASEAGWSFLVEDIEAGAKLRLFLLAAAAAGDPAALDRIDREIATLRMLDDPGILRIAGADRIRDAGYLLLEWTDGFCFQALLRSRREIDPDESLLLLLQLAPIVDAAAARGFSYADPSPRQVFVHFPGNREEPGRNKAAPVDRWPPFEVRVSALAFLRELAGSGTASADGPHRAVATLAALVSQLLRGAGAETGLVASLPAAANAVLEKARDFGYATASEFCGAFESALIDNRGAAASMRMSRRRLPPVLGVILLCLAGLVIMLAVYWPWPHQAPHRETTATPAPSHEPTPIPTPDDAAVMNARMHQADRFASAQDWRDAIESYLDFARTYPDNAASARARLASLLATIRPALDKMPATQFNALRPAITDATNRGYATAMVILADRLRASSPPDAFAWYCAAAAQGDSAAMTQAGLMSSHGEGTPKDLQKAITWFQMASNAGNPEGESCLAECYLYGTAVNKDEPHAVELFQQAANAGDPEAMNYLGTCYEQGLGVPKDFVQAFKLFSRARELGFEDGTGNLGVLYMNGEGVIRDSQKAVSLFEDGAEHGSAYCMYLLAKSYEFGTGVNANQFEAEAWYRKAAAGGNSMALDWCTRNHVTLPAP